MLVPFTYDPGNDQLTIDLWFRLYPPRIVGRSSVPLPDIDRAEGHGDISFAHDADGRVVQVAVARPTHVLALPHSNAGGQFFSRPRRTRQRLTISRALRDERTQGWGMHLDARSDGATLRFPTDEQGNPDIRRFAPPWMQPPTSRALRIVTASDGRLIEVEFTPARELLLADEYAALKDNERRPGVRRLKQPDALAALRDVIRSRAPERSPVIDAFEQDSGDPGELLALTPLVLSERDAARDATRKDAMDELALRVELAAHELESASSR